MVKLKEPFPFMKTLVLSMIVTIGSIGIGTMLFIAFFN